MYKYVSSLFLITAKKKNPKILCNYKKKSYEKFLTGIITISVSVISMIEPQINHLGVCPALASFLIVIIRHGLSSKPEVLYSFCCWYSQCSAEFGVELQRVVYSYPEYEFATLGGNRLSLSCLALCCWACVVPSRSVIHRVVDLTNTK